MTSPFSSQSTLKKFIKVYRGAFDPDLCDQILSEYSPSVSEWRQSAVIGLKGATVDINTRSSFSINLSQRGVIEKNKTIREELDNKIYKILSELMTDYVSNVLPTSKIKQDTGYELLAYPEGSFFNEHTDMITYENLDFGQYVPIEELRPRQLSVSIQLNEDYEGGDFTFFSETYKIIKEKAVVVFWPSNTLFPHKVTPVTKGCRYSIVTWFL